MSSWRSSGRDLLIGAAAGVVGSAVTSVVDRLSDRLVRDALPPQGRAPSGHAEMAARFGRALGGERPSEGARRAGAALFGLAYGVGWGLLYAAARRRAPALGRLGGLPFAAPFFAVCDGAIAPLAGLSPPLTQTPARLSGKELLNHVAWTATAEAVHRAAGRAGASRPGAEARRAGQDAGQHAGWGGAGAAGSGLAERRAHAGDGGGAAVAGAAPSASPRHRA